MCQIVPKGLRLPDTILQTVSLGFIVSEEIQLFRFSLLFHPSITANV